MQNRYYYDDSSTSDRWGASYAIRGLACGGGIDGDTGIQLICGYADRDIFSSDHGRAVCIGWENNIYLYNKGHSLKADSTLNVTSDRDAKKDIMPLDERYVNFFDKLQPVRFHYKYDEDGYPYTPGFIAQDVEVALSESGLTREDMSGISGENGTGHMGLSYESFVPIICLKINDLEKRLKRLEATA